MTLGQTGTLVYFVLFSLNACKLCHPLQIPYLFLYHLFHHQLHPPYQCHSSYIPAPPLLIHTLPLIIMISSNHIPPYNSLSSPCHYIDGVGQCQCTTQLATLTELRQNLQGLWLKFATVALTALALFQLSGSRQVVQQGITMNNGGGMAYIFMIIRNKSTINHAVVN